MQTEQRIVKITGKKDDNILFEGIADGMKWEVVPKPMLSGKEIQIGNYVICFVLQDGDDFYLEQNPSAPFSNKKDWEMQERESQ